jgi:hypothetical protein
LDWALKNVILLNKTPTDADNIFLRVIDSSFNASICSTASEAGKSDIFHGSIFVQISCKIERMK